MDFIQFYLSQEDHFCTYQLNLFRLFQFKFDHFFNFLVFIRFCYRLHLEQGANLKIRKYRITIVILDLNIIGLGGWLLVNILDLNIIGLWGWLFVNMFVFLIFLQ